MGHTGHEAVSIGTREEGVSCFGSTVGVVERKHGQGARCGAGRYSEKD